MQKVKQISRTHGMHAGTELLPPLGLQSHAETYSLGCSSDAADSLTIPKVRHASIAAACSASFFFPETTAPWYFVPPTSTTDCHRDSHGRAVVVYLITSPKLWPRN